MVRIRKILIVVAVVYSFCSCSDKRIDFNIYEFINRDYKEFVLKDGFYNNLYENPLSLSYFSGDSLIFDSICFLVERKIDGLIDTTFIWDRDELGFNVVNKNESQLIENTIDNGFLLVSIPVLDTTSSFVLIKERKVGVSLLEDGNERYILFVREDKQWRYFSEIRLNYPY